MYYFQKAAPIWLWPALLGRGGQSQWIDLLYWFCVNIISVSSRNKGDFAMANNKACVAPAGQSVECNVAETVS